MLNVGLTPCKCCLFVKPFWGLDHDHIPDSPSVYNVHVLESLHGNETRYTSLLNVIITEDDTGWLPQAKVQLLEDKIDLSFLSACL